MPEFPDVRAKLESLAMEAVLDDVLSDEGRARGLLSIAISLKRLADYAEAFVEQNEETLSEIRDAWDHGCSKKCGR